MKKVKVMLTAIAVLTVVGGSLAFKAQKVGNIRLFFTSATPDPDNNQVCNIAGGLYKAHATNAVWATTQNGGICTTLFSTTQE